MITCLLELFLRLWKRMTDLGKRQNFPKNQHEMKNNSLEGETGGWGWGWDEGIAEPSVVNALGQTKNKRRDFLFRKN